MIYWYLSTYLSINNNVYNKKSYKEANMYIKIYNAKERLMVIVKMRILFKILTLNTWAIISIGIDVEKTLKIRLIDLAR